MTLESSADLVLSEPFYAPSTDGALDHLFAQHSAFKTRIEEIAGYMDGATRAALGFFLDANYVKNKERGWSIVAAELLDVPGAIAALDSDFWSKAMALTDLQAVMPQERRSEWNELIRKHKTPPFTPENVLPTFDELLSSRAKFFAERVDGVFRALSRRHVTNQPEGFSKRMILNYVLSEFGLSPDWQRAGYIHDLRVVIARFMGRDEPKHGASELAIRVASENAGSWITLDGGALRLRVYNGVRTGHLEVHPDMAWRLNATLASLYPAAIPSQFREPPARKVRDFALIQKPLPFAILELLRGLKVTGVVAALPWDVKPDKAAMTRLNEVLAAIGGVEAKDGWRFDYCPQEVIRKIVCSGCIPDEKSHQFYPTPEHVAHAAIAAASKGAFEGMRWLEPSAGTGNLAALIPDSAQIDCYDISALHVAVLAARGLPAVEADFLSLPIDRHYDRVVMNPPYSEGRWRAHIEHAARMVKPGGRLVAILPESARGKALLPGWESRWGEVYRGAFPGASVSVSIFTAEKGSRSA